MPSPYLYSDEIAKLNSILGPPAEPNPLERSAAQNYAMATSSPEPDIQDIFISDEAANSSSEMAMRRRDAFRRGAYEYSTPLLQAEIAADKAKQQEFRQQQEDAVEFQLKMIPDNPLLRNIQAPFRLVKEGVVALGVRGMEQVGLAKPGEADDAVQELDKWRLAYDLIDTDPDNPAWSPTFNRLARGAGESIIKAQALAAAGTGVGLSELATELAIITGFSVEEASNALAEGRKAGLEGMELSGHVIRQAAIEAIPAYIASKAGVGGLQRQMARKVTGKSGLIPAIGRTAKSSSQELLDELPTEALHLAETEFSGVAPEGTFKQNIGQTLLDTTGQTLLAGGATGAYQNTMAQPALRANEANIRATETATAAQGMAGPQAPDITPSKPTTTAMFLDARNVAPALAAEFGKMGDTNTAEMTKGAAVVLDKLANTAPDDNGNITVVLPDSMLDSVSIATDIVGQMAEDAGSTINMTIQQGDGNVTITADIRNLQEQQAQETPENAPESTNAPETTPSTTPTEIVAPAPVNGPSEAGGETVAEGGGGKLPHEMTLDELDDAAHKANGGEPSTILFPVNALRSEEFITDDLERNIRNRLTADGLQQDDNLTDKDKVPKLVGGTGRRSKTQIDALKEQIRSKGFDPSRPVSLFMKKDGTIGISDGTHRTLVADELGIESIPITLTPSMINAKGYAAIREASKKFSSPPATSQVTPLPETQGQEVSTGETQAKQPWEMTREEYNILRNPDKYLTDRSAQDKARDEYGTILDRLGKDKEHEALRSDAEDAILFRLFNEPNKYEIAEHAAEVYAAIKSGYSVPNSVLSQYPNIVQQVDDAIADYKKYAMPNSDISRGTPAQSPPAQTQTAKPGEGQDVNKIPPVEVPVDSLTLSKDVPNFKSDADAETGVVPGDEIQGDTYNRFPMNAIIVWKRLSGKMEVITGRHRLEFAKRIGEKTIPAQIVEEAKGFTKGQALTIDAEANIQAGNGKAVDYAQYFRNTEITEKEARAKSLLSRVKEQNGFRIAKSAGDNVYDLFVNGQLTESKAVALSRGAPNSESAQNAALQSAGKMSAGELEVYASILSRTAKQTGKPKQGDLFGFDDGAMVEARLVTEQVFREQKEIRDRIASVEGALKRPETAKKMGVSFTDEVSMRDEVSALKVRLDDLSRINTNPKLYAEMLTRATGVDGNQGQIQFTEPSAIERGSEQAPIKDIEGQGGLFDAGGDEGSSGQQAGTIVPTGNAMAAAKPSGAMGPVVSRATAQQKSNPSSPTMPVSRAISTILDPALELVAPGVRTDAKPASLVFRKVLGEQAQKSAVAENALKAHHAKFAFMPKNKIVQFIDNMEAGRQQETPELNEASKAMRNVLDKYRTMVQGLGKGQLRQYYENYFPHIWKNPDKAKAVIGQILGRRPLQGTKAFLKQRNIMTVKEGLDAGLELVSDNPIDLVLLKTHEMGRYIMAQNLINELKAKGLIQFVYARSKPPAGYQQIHDAAFQVFLPPDATITVKEAYDNILVENMLSIAKGLGIDAQRVMKMRGGAWGMQQGDTVTTRFAGPESVLAHEIGHVLGKRYGVMQYLMGDKTEAYYKKGQNAGQRKTSKTGKPQFEYTDNSPEAIARRKTVAAELRALADLRYEGAEVPERFKKYVRKSAEKEAVLLEALIHAPDKFKATAPTVYDRFTRLLNKHSELRPLLDLKHGLVLGTSEGEIDLPGLTKLGAYYAPGAIATLIDNHLSPGLRNNKNRLIAGSYNMLRKAGNSLNMVQLSLSLFHALNTGFDSVGSGVSLGLRQVGTREQRTRGLANILSSPLHPPINLWRGGQLRKAMLTDMDQITDPKMRKMVEAVVMAGGRLKMDSMYDIGGANALLHTIEKITRGTMGQKVAGVAALPFNVLGTTVRAASYPVMQYWVPRLKLGAFYKMAQHEMDRAQTYNLSDEQLHAALARAWDSVDNRMGEMVYDNLFWNRTLKDAAMISTRSTGWNLGSIREFAGAPVDLLNTPARLRNGDALISHKMGYVAGIAMSYAMAGAILQYLLTGKGPDEPEDYFFPKTGNTLSDGSVDRLSLPTYSKDVYAYATQPWKTIQHKMHPMWGLINDMITNKDFYNTEIRNANDPAVKQMLDSAKYIGKNFLPISVQTYMKRSQNSDTSAPPLLVSMSGITSAPAYIRRTPAHKLMSQYIVGHLSNVSRTKEQAERSQLAKDIREKIRAGVPVRDIDWGTLNDRSKQTILREARIDPFQASFKRLSATEALNVYTIASPEERALVRTALADKMSRLARDSYYYADAMEMYNAIKQSDNLLPGVRSTSPSRPSTSRPTSSRTSSSRPTSSRPSAR